MKVRGSVLDARVAYARKDGVRDFARFLSELPPPTRAVVEEGPRPEQFYDVSLFLDVQHAIGRAKGRADDAFYVELGRYACDHNLSRTNRFLLKLTSLEGALRRAERLWSVHYEGGAFTVVKWGARRARVRIDGPVPAERPFCQSVKGWTLRLSEIVGDRAVTEAETCAARGDPHCELDLVW